MTLLRCSLVCALLALPSLILIHTQYGPPINASLWFSLFAIASVVLGSLGAFVFRKY